MIAICPVGPPKLMKPSFSQKRNASGKLTFIPWPDARPPSGARARSACAAAAKRGIFLLLQAPPWRRPTHRHAETVRAAAFLPARSRAKSASAAGNNRRASATRRRGSAARLRAGPPLRRARARSSAARPPHRFVGGNAELRKYHALVHQVIDDIGIKV